MFGNERRELITIEDRIAVDLKNNYGIICNKIAPVTGGWMNQLWKVSTAECELLVKQYSNKRFSRKQLKLIEAALQRQIIIEKAGVPCPAIRQCRDRAIRLVDNETAYLVMDFCLGKAENSDTITTTQMHSLGNACGLMHKAFSQLPANPAARLPAFGGYTLDLLWSNFSSRVMKCSPDTNIEYRDALLAQESILKQLTNEFFDKFRMGIAHEDFTAANILFDRQGVSAIVDFDRSCYSYIWHDIGRAILSFALKENEIDIEKVSAFIDGYKQHLALTLPDIADALRLSWCIEIPWWIQPEFFTENKGKAGRYKEEILWITEHWSEIDSLIS